MSSKTSSSMYGMLSSTSSNSNLKRRRRSEATLVSVFSLACSFLVCFSSLTTLRQLLAASRHEAQFESRYPLSKSGALEDDYIPDAKSIRKLSVESTKISQNRKLFSSEGDQQTDEDDLSQGNIQLLAFGSSSTWGEDLQHVRHEAYPYLLDEQASNVASRVGGAALAAACAQSMVDGLGFDEVTDYSSKFNLITMEFESFDESAMILTRRLRQRFPTTTLVWIQLWNPSHWVYKQPSDSTDGFGFETWRESNGNYSLNSPELFDSFVASGLENWSMQPHVNHTLTLRQRQVLAETDTLVYQLTQPDLKTGLNVQSMLSLFQGITPYALSKTGHEYVAAGVRDLLQSVHSQSQDGKEFSIPAVQTPGNWGSGDQCNLWYANGNSGSVKASNPIVNFARQADEWGQEEHKHAIEFMRVKSLKGSNQKTGSVISASGGGGKLMVKNPFHEERMLYLTYMAGSGGDYPRTRVRINGEWTVLVDPLHDHDIDNNLHWAQTSAVGWLPANSEATVELFPIRASRNNFRVVGASIIFEEMDQIPIEYALEAEPALVV